MSLLSHFLKNASKQFQNNSKKAFNIDELLNWRKELELINFKKESPSSLTEKFIIGSDADIGGKSSVNLSLNDCGHAVFSGNISPYMPNYLEIKVHGYAAFKLKTPENGFFESELFDTLPFRYLALRVRGTNGKNGMPPIRRFTVNIQTDSLIPSDLFQHRLFLNKPGEWETVLIPFNEFVLTNDGAVEPQQMSMFREKVKSIGISLLDQKPGPFKLEIDWIKAYNSPYTDGDMDIVPE
ncbi:CIA30-domain-containing protein [Neoconidiobolus thromboides FSU 785]|nr:CIA30-domain-containing protein [Neoconidiobolus thromboides FSU 785]